MIPATLLPLLFLTGLAAGLVDSVAGGGGLLTVPVLLATGLPPQLALGTNKFQACFGSFTAAHNYLGQRTLSWNDLRAGVALTLVGAVSAPWPCSASPRCTSSG